MSPPRPEGATQSPPGAPTAAPLPSLRIALIGVGAIPIPPPGWGAVEDYISNLARELRTLGDEVSIVNRIPPVRPARARELLSAATLRSALPKGRFDILHANSPITAEALTLLGRPYVLTSHSRYWLSEVRGIERVWRARDTRAVRSALGVVALTPQVVPLFRSIRGNRAAPESVTGIPFGVDLERFHPAADGRAREGIVGLGVVARHKRFDILAAAAREVGCRATIIGPVPDPAVREGLLRVNPDLAFTGEVPALALADRLAAGRVFVHPSDMELASVATVQALASGLPVVGSDLLGGIVTHGHDGFLVDHREPFDSRVRRTAGFVRSLLEDESLWRTMSAHARSTAVDQHSWGGIARQLREFYRRLAPGGRAVA